MKREKKKIVTMFFFFCQIAKWQEFTSYHEQVTKIFTK